MTHQTDPFEQELRALNEAADTENLTTEFYKQHLDGLYSTALLRGGDPDYKTHYMIPASRLADIQATADDTERRDKERQLLAEFEAYTPPQLVIDVTLEYFPMDPLTEEDAGLVAEEIAKREIALDRIEAIMHEIDELTDELEKKTGEPIEFNEFEEGYMMRFMNDYSSYLHETPKEERPVQRANLLESVNIMSDKANLHPAVRHIVTTLLHDSDGLDT